MEVTQNWLCSVRFWQTTHGDGGERESKHLAKMARHVCRNEKLGGRGVFWT